MTDTRGIERQLMEDVVESETHDGPYLRKVLNRRIEVLSYNPNFGDDRKCRCGHHYYRHFDPYEQWFPVGCKYCECFSFEEQRPTLTLRKTDGNSPADACTTTPDDVADPPEMAN